MLQNETSGYIIGIEQIDRENLQVEIADYFHMVKNGLDESYDEIDESILRITKPVSGNVSAES